MTRKYFPGAAWIRPSANLTSAILQLQTFCRQLCFWGMLVAIVLRKFRPPFSYACEVAASFCNVLPAAFLASMGGQNPYSAFFLAAPLARIYMERAGKSRALQNCHDPVFFLLWTFMAFQGGLRRVGVFDNNQKNFLYSPRAPTSISTPTSALPGHILTHGEFSGGPKPPKHWPWVYDDAFEYPLWALLSEKVKKMPTNLSSAFPENDRESSIPQFIVVLGKGEGDAPLALPFLASWRKRGNSYIKFFPPDRDRNDLPRKGQPGGEEKCFCISFNTAVRLPRRHSVSFFLKAD